MDGFSPHLPFVVAREGFELDLQAVLLHCFHSLGGQCASRVIGTDGDVEQVESLVELGALRQDARHDGLKVHAASVWAMPPKIPELNMPKEENLSRFTSPV